MGISLSNYTILRSFFRLILGPFTTLISNKEVTNLSFFLGLSDTFRLLSLTLRTQQSVNHFCIGRVVVMCLKKPREFDTPKERMRTARNLQLVYFAYTILNAAYGWENSCLAEYQTHHQLGSLTPYNL